ncbi:MAG: HDOD domain-containing protein [Desulforegulaceae bacterium]|nr:HDOD domain-containing protein [Desulforegulaceae bacterium]
MDVFIARQPVFYKDKKTFGYELLFRDGFKNSFPEMDGNIATTKVLSSSFFSFGFNEITSNKNALVNFTREHILNKTPITFPEHNLIVEVLENILPEKKILDSLSDLKKKGYKIALDDFVFSNEYEPLIMLADIIKFDLIATPLKQIEPLVKMLKNKYKKIVFLAEKVETYEEFEKAKELGFSLFQGYFFAKPEIISNKEIPSQKLALARLVKEISACDPDSKKILDIIKKDISISYKLLKFINSSYFSRPCKIDTIKDTMTFLGIDELKKYISLIATAGLTDNKPNELLKNSVFRARMCELIGSQASSEFRQDELFTIGLFSLIEAMLDKKMDDIIREISFSTKITKALTGQNKTINKILNLISYIETGHWEKIKNVNKNNLAKLMDYYLDAIKMADSIL